MKEHPELPSEQEPTQPENRDPIPIGDVIRAFRRQPERFIADTFPEPPEAA